MPSSVVAQVLEIKDLRPHPNADRLQLATLGGWQIVCGKDLYKEGDRVVYITPDSLIPQFLAEELDIVQHLGSVKNPDGTFVVNEFGEKMLRVRQAKLRGEPSFGTTIPWDIMSKTYHIDIDLVELGTNLAERIGIGKYEPQMRASAGDAAEDHPLFVKYTSIENLRNYPDIIGADEYINITEKIHGTNCRVGLVENQFMAGSHGLRRADPCTNPHGFPMEEWKKNTYWYPLSLAPVHNLLTRLGQDFKQVILFGEVYGNIQKKYHYGTPNGIGFRAFDLMLDGKYVDSIIFKAYCEQFEVETVPFLYSGNYVSFDAVSEFMESYKTSEMSDQHPMEGGVIRLAKERTDRKVGRVILKYLTNAYLFDKGKSDFTDR